MQYALAACEVETHALPIAAFPPVGTAANESIADKRCHLHRHAASALAPLGPPVQYALAAHEVETDVLPVVAFPPAGTAANKSIVADKQCHLHRHAASALAPLGPQAQYALAACEVETLALPIVAFPPAGTTADESIADKQCHLHRHAATALAPLGPQAQYSLAAHEVETHALPIVAFPPAGTPANESISDKQCHLHRHAASALAPLGSKVQYALAAHEVETDALPVVAFPPAGTTEPPKDSILSL